VEIKFGELQTIFFCDDAWSYQVAPAEVAYKEKRLSHAP